jgi:hypothetical protein
MLPLADITEQEVQECAELCFNRSPAHDARMQLERLAMRIGERQWNHAAVVRVVRAVYAAERFEAQQAKAKGELPPVRFAESDWADILMEYMPMSWKLEDCDKVLRMLVAQCGHIEVDALTFWDGVELFKKRFTKKG